MPSRSIARWPKLGTLAAAMGKTSHEFTGACTPATATPTARATCSIRTPNASSHADGMRAIAQRRRAAQLLNAPRQQPPPP